MPECLSLVQTGLEYDEGPADKTLHIFLGVYILLIYFFTGKEIQKRHFIPNLKTVVLNEKSRGSIQEDSPSNAPASKRILGKLRRMAKHMVHKMRSRVSSAPLG